jgi:XRE family transcriptional regulator, regulator of sulfur utilization
VWQRPALKRAIDREQRRLARRLRALRAQLALTQEAAAERAGIHAKYLVRVEAGDANPTVAVLVALARGYGVPLTALFE